MSAGEPVRYTYKAVQVGDFVLISSGGVPRVAEVQEVGRVRLAVAPVAGGPAKVHGFGSVVFVGCYADACQAFQRYRQTIARREAELDAAHQQFAAAQTARAALEADVERQARLAAQGRPEAAETAA